MMMFHHGHFLKKSTTCVHRKKVSMPSLMPTTKLNQKQAMLRSTPTFSMNIEQKTIWFDLCLNTMQDMVKSNSESNPADLNTHFRRKINELQDTWNYACRYPSFPLNRSQADDVFFKLCLNKTIVPMVWWLLKDFLQSKNSDQNSQAMDFRLMYRDLHLGRTKGQVFEVLSSISSKGYAINIADYGISEDDKNSAQPLRKGDATQFWLRRLLKAHSSVIQKFFLPFLNTEPEVATSSIPEISGLCQVDDFAVSDKDYENQKKSKILEYADGPTKPSSLALEVARLIQQQGLLPCSVDKSKASGFVLKSAAAASSPSTGQFNSNSGEKHPKPEPPVVIQVDDDDDSDDEAPLIANKFTTPTKAASKEQEPPALPLRVSVPRSTRTANSPPIPDEDDKGTDKGAYFTSSGFSGPHPHHLDSNKRKFCSISPPSDPESKSAAAASSPSTGQFNWDSKEPQNYKTKMTAIREYQSNYMALKSTGASAEFAVKCGGDARGVSLQQKERELDGKAKKTGDNPHARNKHKRSWNLKKKGGHT